MQGIFCLGIILPKGCFTKNENVSETPAQTFCFQGNADCFFVL